MSRGRRVGQGGNVVSWLVLGLVVLAAGLYGALCLVAGDKVPAGTTVDGVANDVFHIEGDCDITDLERRLSGRRSGAGANPIAMVGSLLRRVSGRASA